MAGGDTQQPHRPGQWSLQQERAGFPENILRSLDGIGQGAGPGMEGKIVVFDFQGDGVGVKSRGFQMHANGSG